MNTTKQLSAGGGNPSLQNPALDSSIRNLDGLTFFQKVLPNFVTLALLIGSLIFIAMLVTGGIAWIGSGGDKAKLEGAQKRISHALLGIVVLFSVFAIIGLVESIFGLHILALDIQGLFLQ